MTEAWRLDKAARSREESFSGLGAQIAGGRWNRKGVAAVYASETLALAALEKFVHTQPEARRMELVSYRLEIPDPVRIDRARPDRLPKNWRDHPAPPETEEFGTEWLLKRSAAVLLVPSVIVPGESNLLINPSHPDFSRIKIAERKPFAFDARMWK